MTGSSEHYQARAAELQAAIDHLKLPAGPAFGRDDLKAVRLALGADDDELLDFAEALQELITEMRTNALDLATLAASELSPRVRHERLLRLAEASAAKHDLEGARQYADLARIWAQAIIEFPTAPKGPSA